MGIMEKDRCTRLHIPKADSGSLSVLLLTLESPQVTWGSLFRDVGLNISSLQSGFMCLPSLERSAVEHYTNKHLLHSYGYFNVYFQLAIHVVLDHTHHCFLQENLCSLNYFDLMYQHFC